MKFKIIFILIAIYIGSFYQLSFSQQIGETKENNEPNIGLQQVLNNYDTQKQREKEELTAKLNFNLTQAINIWLNLAEKNQEKRLNLRIEQNWEKLPLTIALSQVHYEYFLKGYNYSVTKRDVIKTEALTFPYKGIVTVKEEIYAEQYHHANTSNRADFFYTITTIYTLNFDYQEEAFILTNTDSTITFIKNTAPKEIIKF